MLERGYSYVAASGLALAATLGGSLPQPLLGVLADRRPLLWLAPAGLGLAGLGAGLAGLAPSYALVWLLLLLSGIGVAAFHPASGRDARRDAGGSAAAMSLFAAGGSVGFFLAPALATPVLVSLGVGGTAVFVAPAVLTAVVLWRYQQRRGASASTVKSLTGQDHWGPFAVLTVLEVARSVVFFGVNTFVVLYWIRSLGAGDGLGGVALAAFLTGGVAGTLLGGRLADRFGMLPTIRAGSVAVIPRADRAAGDAEPGVGARLRGGRRGRGQRPVRGPGETGAGLPAHPAGDGRGGHPRPRGERGRAGRSAVRPAGRPPRSPGGVHGAVRGPATRGGIVAAADGTRACPRMT